MSEKECKCKTCKYLKGLFTPTDKGVQPSFICTANEQCYIVIDELLEMQLDNCVDYEFAESMDTNINADIKDLQKLGLMVQSIQHKKDIL